MSIFSKLGALIFAPTDAAGNPRQVINHDAQVWSTEVERIIQVALDGGDLLVYGSLTALNADLDHPAHTGAILIGESIADDGLYMKQGASGSGSWVKIGNVPGQGFVKATNAGAGTANAIAATTPVAVNETQLILLPITAANTASPVTVAFNGGAALTVKTVSGNDVAAGGLPVGSVMLGAIQGGNFRLLSDQASAAIQAAVEAAKVAAEQARDEAEAAQAAAESAAGANLSSADSRAAAALTSFPGVVNYVRTAGYDAAGDGGGALYKRAASEPAHTGKFQSVDGAWWDLVDTDVTPLMFGAEGDGVANDDAVFSSFEVIASGRTVDLAGRTYAVTAIPTKNRYVNGYFNIDGRTRSTLLFNESPYHSPRWEDNGGQVRKLKSLLMNPLCQSLGIVLVGDSITWGATLPDNAITTPRDGTLSDPRDDFTSSSWANELKRYIGRVYAKGVVPTVSNWPAAGASGEAIALYEFDDELYPGYDPFTLNITGGSTTISETMNVAGSRLAAQLRFDIGGSTSYVDIDFTFTGTEFTLFYTSISGETNADYELFVDGVSQGTFSTSVGVDGAVDGQGNSRTHTFGYVRDKLIRIRAKQKAPGGTLSRFRGESILVPRKIKITNQGINGIAARNYYNNCLSGSYGDGVAIGDEDRIIICQLGANDRGNHATLPQGATGFRKSLSGLIPQLVAFGDVVMMCSNPTDDFNPSIMNLGMGQIRSVIQDLAASSSLDFIDNFSAFIGYDSEVVLADGLHPNRLGHAIMFRNIIGAIEAS
ncbi:SGNH/GDSL hydrolase family protein [Hoeflea sp.]|uniref:SGNH/GDSL hydrolase family protein n=1 Tax=Hoeflea sp. TaxID=1940281 RepID=UPI003A94892E